MNVTLRDLGFMLIYFMDLFLMDEMVLILKSYYILYVMLLTSFHIYMKYINICIYSC